MSIPAGAHHVRQRQDRMVLVEMLASLARSDPRAAPAAAELVRSGRVQVNGNICSDQAREVRAGDVVKVLPHAIARAARREDVRVAYVDDAVIVIEKPPGITSTREPAGRPAHSAGAQRGSDKSASAHGRRPRPGRQATLEELVEALLTRGQMNLQNPAPRPRRSRAHSRQNLPRERRLRATSAAQVFPVHRLDRDTSGLMVFARTAQAERALTAQFKARQIDRRYLAVVHGHPEAMTISTHIVRDRGDGLRGSAEVWGKDPAAGQRAVTHVEPLERIGPYALVRCVLETGRTHQIRIHLAEQGHMLCGEKEYTRRPDGSRSRDSSGAPRHALHAEALAFVHPVSGREMRFASRLPEDLRRWLKQLRPRHSV